MKNELMADTAAFRIPPQDLEAEQSVLGAMILSKQAIVEAAAKLKPLDFYREKNRIVFNAILQLFNKNEEADIITLKNQLSKMGQFDAIGGINTLTELIDRVPTAANIEYYCNIVKVHSANRTLINITSQAMADAYSNVSPLEISERLVAQVVNGENLADTMTSMQMAFEATDAVLDEKNKPFIKTGWPKFDEEIGGARRGVLTTITGQSEHGKSTGVQNVCLHMAKAGIKCSYVYLDDNPLVLPKRHVCIMNNWSIRKLESMDRSIISDSKKIDAFSAWAALNIRVCGRKQVGTKWSSLKLWMLREWKTSGIQAFFIDSGNRIQNQPLYQETRFDAQERMVDELEQFAQATGVVLWVIVGQAKTKKDKFAIEDDDEIGTNAWRNYARMRLKVGRHKEAENDANFSNVAILKITKNTDGPKGSFMFRGTRETYRWTEVDVDNLKDE